MATISSLETMGNAGARGAQHRLQGDNVWLLAIAAVIALLHIATNGRYGFHRDELQFLSDARHLDWGFVAYPPFTPLVERISLSIFGLSLVGLRLASVLFQAAAIVMTGLMARELGGNRLAQLGAALCIALSPLPIFEGTEFQYSSFDYLWWVLIAYFTIRLLKTDDPRWWVAIGAIIGLGMQTKYTMGFYVAGIVGGVLLTHARKYLLSRWLWAGVALSILIFLPNLIWQIRHDFISLHFLQSIHTRDVGEGRSDGFLKGQFLICASLFAAPVWIAGLIGYFRNRRYRMLAWMYVIPLLLFVIGKGRDYYLAAAYPMLLAMGATMAERWLISISKPWRVSIAGVFFTLLILGGAYVCALLVPLASDGPLKKFALEKNGELREEIGWDDLVRNVAAIRDSLPPEQREHVGIVVRNYGEAGAIEILGQPYHLPPPISGTNTAWLRGYPDPPPTTLIVLGTSFENANRRYTDCRLAGHNGNSLGVVNEESRDHPDIFICGSPRLPWPEFWKSFQAFG
ncbi:MAG TPA: glycosyltransferase family 39 protein [Candidatus Eisenbacteria bacterium]|nr:glycosyltransferase family 39 protein [Candidatus Eisenbacteria bacterium]